MMIQISICKPTYHFEAMGNIKHQFILFSVLFMRWPNDPQILLYVVAVWPTLGLVEQGIF